MNTAYELTRLEEIVRRASNTRRPFLAPRCQKDGFGLRYLGQGGDPFRRTTKVFHEDPDGNWDGFADRYRKELEFSPALDTLIQQIIASKCDSVTLLYAFRNKTHNHAFILQQELEKRLK